MKKDHPRPILKKVRPNHTATLGSLSPFGDYYSSYAPVICESIIYAFEYSVIIPWFCGWNSEKYGWDCQLLDDCVCIWISFCIIMICGFVTQIVIANAPPFKSWNENRWLPCHVKQISPLNACLWIVNSSRLWGVDRDLRQLKVGKTFIGQMFRVKWNHNLQDRVKTGSMVDSPIGLKL